MRNKDKRLVHWSPTQNYSRASSLDVEVGDGIIYCQAVVQILFADSNREWTVGQIGELVLYKTSPKRPVDAFDLFLSFFASERYRFLIKLSEGAKFWRTNKNFVAIQHGCLIGLNFAIEHSHQVELLIKHMQNFYQPLLLTERFIRAIKQWRKPHPKVRTKLEPVADTSPPYVVNSKLVVDEATMFINKKKPAEIGDEFDEPDPILQPREFLKQMTDCPDSFDV